MDAYGRGLHPMKNAFVVVPGLLVAGEYLGTIGRDEAARNLRALLRTGIDHFVDLLREADRLKPDVGVVQQQTHIKAVIGRTGTVVGRCLVRYMLNSDGRCECIAE